MTTQHYIFNTAEDGEHERLRVQAEMCDRLTRRRIQEIGIGEGWSCLEVGGGIGTVTRWLTGQAGSTGRVVATDLEPHWLRELDADNLEVLRHDVSADPLGEAEFDLITVRLVLVHLQDPRAVLDKLITALKPGGTLLVEECDLSTMPLSDPPDDTWHEVISALVSLLASMGPDPYLGRRLTRMMLDAGLHDVDSEVVAYPRLMPESPSLQVQVVKMRDPLIESGRVSQGAVDELIARFGDPTCDLVLHNSTIHSVCGRKPR
ncbi:methyltransferase domain-containing protein [Saccharopolyspora tripterygii]